MATSSLGTRLVEAFRGPSVLRTCRVHGGGLRQGRRLFKPPPRRSVTTQELDAAKGDRERILVLGSGWGGFPLSRNLDPAKFQTVVVSPRSYFVFTPLLASTAVGTLEFRAALEPVRRRRGRNGAYGRGASVDFFEAWADKVDLNRKVVTAESAVLDVRATSALTTNSNGECDRKTDVPATPGKREMFEIEYDKLVIAVGSYSQTFGIAGVKENAFFLKDVMDARKIRKRVLSCFELASLPIATEAQKQQLLHFAVVGGGPTGMEFSAELHDFVRQDLRRLYPSLMPYVTITIYDVAPSVLGMFDRALSEYAVNAFRRDGIRIRTGHHVESLSKGFPPAPATDEGRPHLDPSCGFTVRTKQEGSFGVGLCVWSTGLMANPFVKSTLSHPWDLCDKTATPVTGRQPLARPVEGAPWTVKTHKRSGAILTDDQFRVKVMRPQADGQEATEEAVVKDVFAIGDTAAMESKALPATAQVASQKAQWLAKHLNKGDLDRQAFAYKNLGVMAFLGNFRGIMQGENNVKVKGIIGWLLWRTAYLAKTISWRNRVIIFMYWVINGVLGRDISRF